MNTNMISNIKSSAIIALIGMSVIIGGYYGYQYWTLPEESLNLSAEEAITIAKQDNEVSSWVIQYKATEAAEYTDGLWYVQFSSTAQPGTFLLAKVDDASATLIDYDQISLGGPSMNAPNMETGAPVDTSEDAMSSAPQAGFGYYNDVCEGGFYTDCGRYYSDMGENFSQAAIDFVKSLDYIIIFDNYEMEFYAYGYQWEDDNYGYVWAYYFDEVEDEYIYIDFGLDFTEITDNSWTFSVTSISSNVIFVETEYTLDDVWNLIEASDEYLNYTSIVSSYNDYVYFQYLNDIFTFTVSLYPEYNWDEYEYYDNETDPSTPTDNYEYSWIEFVVEDGTGIAEIWGTHSNSLSESDVFAIALQSANLTDWFNSVVNYDLSASYSGRGYWYVYLYDEVDYYSYAYVYINDRTSEIEYIYSMIAIPALHEEYEMHSMVENLEFTSDFFDQVDNYESYYYYDHYGSWWISYYDTDDWRNYFYLQVNDSDLSIQFSGLWLITPATMAESEVVDVAMDAGLSEFIDLYDNIDVYIYYDGYGTHFVYAYDAILIEAFAFAAINDTSAELIHYYEYHPEILPEMEVNEVLNIALNTENYTEFLKNCDIAYYYLYFYRGTWYFYAYGLDYEDTWYGYSLSIDDSTGEIIDEWSYSYNEVYYEDTVEVAFDEKGDEDR
ncbi:MAG: hypothetical protein INQ03_23145 [Candidatus Heimdallarchaeota archaeon]|nr:hypothetical protein [Candidatus Heimdallarchaeota archaeon]